MQIELLYKKFLESTGVTTDTRNISEGNIFFALKGDKFNANEFAEEAFNKGARYVVIDEIKNENWKEKFGRHLILVADVLRTLQQLSGYHREQLQCPVLAITGSNGKTTTKELVAAVLSMKFKTYATKGNLNNHIGIPLTLLSIKRDIEFAVIEMGANHQGEITSYCEYVKPDYGLITNVGHAHLEGFGGFEGVVRGKTELYYYLSRNKGRVFVNATDDTLIEKLSDYGFDVLNTSQIIMYGNSPLALCKGEASENKEFLSVIVDSNTIQTNLVGEYNFENVMSAVCIGKYFGVELNQIKEAIENYLPTNNRSQKISWNSNTIILDAYNANPSSMLEALKNFEKTEAKNKVVILGQMMELGKYAEVEHKKIFTVVSTGNWQNIKKVFVGNGFEFLKNNSIVLWFEKTDELKTWFREQQFENACILIKGSRKNELEKILKD